MKTNTNQAHLKNTTSHSEAQPERRTFLAQLGSLSAAVGMYPAGMAALGMSATSHAQSNAPTPTSPHVLVIGAGMAGLTVARSLHDAGIKVTIIEGRNRVGGRLHTSKAWPELPIDLGASWIHGIRNNPITQLANQYNAQRITTDYESAQLHLSQALKDSGIRAEAFDTDSVANIVERALQLSEKQDQDTSLQAAVNTLLARNPLSRDEQTKLNFYINSKYEQEYAGDSTDLSAHTIDDNEVFSGLDALFPKGYNQISDGLANGLDIHTEQIVRSIDYRLKDTISVRTQNQTFIGTHCVVTLPLGVLKAESVEFLPKLPEQKSQAIEQLGMGLLNKHFLRFDRVFWDASFDWHEYVHQDKGRWTEWVSFAKVGNTPVLLGFSAASRAKQMERWTDEQITTEAMHALRDMFGKDIPQPISHQFTRWSQDPFALGSYSYNAVGSTNEDRQALSAPIDQRLYWAGEACSSEYPGTVHGAHLSGLSTARELRKQLNR